MKKKSETKEFSLKGVSCMRHDFRASKSVGLTFRNKTWGCCWLICLLAGTVIGEESQICDKQLCCLKEIEENLVLDSTWPKLLPEGELVIELDIPEESTGTMHFAERVEIYSGQYQPLVLVMNETDEFQELIPIIDRQIEVEPSIYLLLGWSSYGSGMQTQEAFLVRWSGERISLIDRLTMNSDRPSGFFLLDATPGEFAIGIVKPGIRKFLHNPDEWYLRLQGHQRDLEGLRALSSFEIFAGACNLFVYNPPFHIMEDIELNGRQVVWIAAKAQGFKLNPRKVVNEASPSLPRGPSLPKVERQPNNRDGELPHRIP